MTARLFSPKRVAGLSWRRISIRYYAADTSALPIPDASEMRTNEVNVQMLSANLHKQLFPECYRNADGTEDISLTRALPDLLELAKKHLEMHKIPFAEPRSSKPEVDLKLPPFLGKNVEEHFWRVGLVASQEYRQLAEEFATRYTAPLNFDFMMNKWSQRSGWTCYSYQGDDLGPCEFPAESVLVFDVETCVSFGPFPLMAVAASTTNIYGWVSPLLFEHTDESAINVPRLIPMKDDAPSLVIGHNVSYDRARLAGEYHLYPKSPRRFIDTMSLHCAVAGLSSQQRADWTIQQKQNEAAQGNLNPDGVSFDADSAAPEESDKWVECSSMNNLAACVKLHCGHTLDKGPRDILVKGTIDDVRANFQNIFTYCGNDVAITMELFRQLWKKFTIKCPHPVTFAALLEMSTCILPINNTWSEYIETSERMFEESKVQTEALLRTLVDEVVTEGQKLSPEELSSDPWLGKLDWTPVPARYTKARLLKNGNYATGGEPRPIGNTALFGKPAWFKKIYSSKLGAVEITPRLRILPYLLRMKWKGNPVHFIEEFGWCYQAPEGEPLPPNAKLLRDDLFPGHKYLRIPHHEKEGANVGSLMTKHHLKFYEKGILTTDSPIVKALMDTNTAFTFWIGYRERIRDQFAIWKGEPGTALEYESGDRAGMIIPTLVTMGTVTRRAVEPLWMTASNAKKNLVGSELKSKVVAPKGWAFVGADVDSQELWISSLFGDAQFGFPGSTAISWMTLQGARADNTDLHSRTAQILGMKRDDAKIFNYGRIYGAGVTYAAQLLQKFNPTMSKAESEQKAKDLYAATKGKKVPDPCSRRKKIYSGGSETFMFNVLEQIADSPESTTPTLCSVISDALLSDNVDGDFLTSRVNWAVQSSGVDYLHMLLCSMSYLMKKFNITGRLAITIHDEVRYLVKEEDQFRAALALQIANIWTRSMFAYRVGMHDLPLSVAFFSAVDFDKVLRKEAGADCITPSNPTAVPPGFALDMYGLLQKLPEGLGKERKDIMEKYERQVLREKVALRKQAVGRSTAQLIEVQIHGTSSGDEPADSPPLKDTKPRVHRRDPPNNYDYKERKQVNQSYSPRAQTADIPVETLEKATAKTKASFTYMKKNVILAVN